ncbi:THAP domain containing_ apoptosis associated protein 2, partial [Caligus rogercresseyi]
YKLDMNASGDEVIMEQLPGGWTKRSVQRRKEPSRWDTTLCTPNNVKIRSRIALIRYISEKQIVIDPRVINFEQPFSKTDSNIKSLNEGRFITEVK